jgi:putative spermidine/putrescine transport system permease protein
MNAIAAGAGRLFLIAMYVFIIGPMMFVFVASINSAMTFPAAFEGFTFRWYAAILNRPEFIKAAWNSALVAAVSSLIATALAFLAGYALLRGRKRENVVVSTILASPILVPQIVVSLALLQFASHLGIGTGYIGLLAAHTVHGLPFALRLVMSGLSRFNFALEDASLSLGAGRMTTWWRITLPMLRANLIAGFTFCFIISFVNLPISLFLTNPQVTTLPLVMFAFIESRIDPMIAAVSSAIVAAACIATVVLERYMRIRLVE